MGAPNTIGGLNNTGPGMSAQTTTVTGELDTTEYDKVLICTGGSGLAAAETVLIYTRHPDGTSAIGGGPNGTVPVYDSAGNAAKLTATLQSIMLEGGWLYVLVKSVTAGNCSVNFAFKRNSTS